MLKAHLIFSHIPTLLTNYLQSMSSKHCTSPL